MTNPMIVKTHGKFKIDKVTKKIAFIDDENKKFEIPFEYKDEILFLQMKMENAYMKIGLKKN